MTLQEEIGKLFETIATLKADDFIINSAYDTGIDHISVNVFYDRTWSDFDDLSCYVSLKNVQKLKAELIELHNEYRGLKQ